MINNDKELIDAMEKTRHSRIFAAQHLAKWFEISVTIKMFGVTIFSWQFPPKENESENDSCIGQNVD